MSSLFRLHASTEKLARRSFSRPRGAAKLVALITVVVVLLAAVFGWTMFMRASHRADVEAHGVMIGSMTGLARPIKNTLLAPYVDANKDLVADAPAEAAQQIDPAEIVFTYVASEDSAGLEATFKPFMDAIAAATGKPVRFLALGDADSEMNALHDGKLHVCAFNTGSVPAAVDVAGFVPVALLGGESGPSTYQLKIIASTKSGIGSIESLRGRELALTDMTSNSGYKAPLVLLQKQYGLRPGFDFGIRYSMGHVQSIDGLVAGTYEAIATASDVLARAESSGKIKPADYRVLYTSDAFPTACFGYASNLKPELTGKIKAALVGLTLKEGAAATFFGASGQTKLVATDYAKDFALVREIDDAIGYEHKLRAPPAAEEPTTLPTTVPTTMPTAAAP